MQRARLVVPTTAALGAALAFLLGTVGTSSPADAEASPLAAAPTDRPRPIVRRVAEHRSEHVRLPVPVRMLSHTVTLSLDVSDALTTSTAIAPGWDAERVWPLPDELPEHSVLFALQDVFAADDTDRSDALDELDAVLMDAGPASEPWVQLAVIEAERTLARAAYDDAIVHHEAELEAWAAAGGVGPLPEPPVPWSAVSLGSDAHALSMAVDVFQDDPMAGNLARLTAAASWLDWTSDDIDEARAVELLVEVLDRSDDPLVVASAADLLVGTATDLPEGALSDLEDRIPQLPEDVAMRVAWFAADRHLASDDPSTALRVLDLGIEAGSMARSSDDAAVLDTLQQARSAVFGQVFGPGGQTLPDALDALAWHCWSRMVTIDEAWVADGTDYEGTLLMVPSGPHWMDWTDDNPHRDCLVEGSEHLPSTAVPTQIRFRVAVAL